MKTYLISRHYDGNLSLEIKANTPEEAIAEFIKQENKLTDAELIKLLGLQASHTVEYDMENK